MLCRTHACEAVWTGPNGCTGGAATGKLKCSIGPVGEISGSGRFAVNTHSAAPVSELRGSVVAFGTWAQY